jgi:hypothetical protein
MDAAKSYRTLLRTNGSRIFLLDLHHPQILLRAVLCERDTEIGEEAEDSRSVVLKPIQEIFGPGLFDALFPGRHGRRWRLSIQASFDRRMVGRNKLLKHFQGQTHRA